MLRSVLKYSGLIITSSLLIYTYSACKSETSEGQQQVLAQNIYPNPQNGYGNGPDQLAQPDDVEILANGDLIISDVDNNRLQVFKSTGELRLSIDSEYLGLTDPEIIPTGIAQDGEGNIYVTLEGAGVVARLNPDLSLDQFIGYKGHVSSEAYYLPENDGLLINPQGLIVSKNGDIFVADMAKDVFRKKKVYNFGFRKFKKVQSAEGTSYTYDLDFAKSQEVTRIMRKSEGMAISEERGLLFVAEEKPEKDQFGNEEKYRFIGVFDLETGKFKNRLIGVEMVDGKIVSGYCDDSIEGLSVLGDYLYAVVEKDGRVDCYNIDSGKRVLHFGSRAPFYCDDESDCVIDGVNYNEQNIIAGGAVIHTLNDWKKNELASPDGVCAVELKSGKKVLGVVDQWNSRILTYDIDALLGK